MTQPPPIFEAEPVPGRPVRLIAGIALWPALVVLYWIVGETFHLWALTGGVLDIPPVGLPLVLLCSVVILLAIQRGAVGLQQWFEIGLSRRRAVLFWLSWSVVGILVGTVQTFANLPPDEGLGRPAMLLMAYALSFLFGLALWIRFNN